MRIKTIELYQFDELSDKAKEKAREWYREGMYDYDWHDGIYDNAKNIGLEITEFDLYRSFYGCKGKLVWDALEVAEAILKEHGEQCDTYKTALHYLPTLKEENDNNLEDRREMTEEKFLNDLLKDYFKILKDEAEYLESNESVDENIKCNEYEFTKEGKRS